VSGVWISFSRHSPLAKLASRLIFVTHQVRKQLAKNTVRISDGGKKLARLAYGFVFLLANPEFYSHLAIYKIKHFRLKSKFKNEKKTAIFLVSNQNLNSTT
jgi:hypothetical protein